MADYSELVKRLRTFATWKEDGAVMDEAADAIEQMNVPIAVRCYDDCYWVCDDFGDEYTPPSSECGKEDDAFEKLNLDPCYSERDDVDCPDCPFYLNRSKIEEMVGRYHYYEWDWGDGV